MWVADGGNNRVLRFPLDPVSGEIAESPDIVLGQVDFNSVETGDGLDELHAPSAVRFDNDGKAYVVDTVNDRVLVYEPPFESGMKATSESGSQFHRPTSLEIDPDGRGVWVHDSGNNMVELWDPTGSSVLKVLGKRTYRPDHHCGSTLDELPGAPHMCPSAGGIGIDRLGNILIPSFVGRSEVFRFPVPFDEDLGGQAGRADRRLFFPPIGANFNDDRGLHSARGVAVWQDQLIVSDIGRLMFWNGLNELSSGRTADGAVGDKFFFEDGLKCCGRIKVDTSGRLWTLGFEGRSFLDVYELPLTDYSVPLHTIWKSQAEFPVLGTNEEVIVGGRVFGLAPVGAGEFLWLSDTDNHRVLRIRDPITNPVVDVVLGQEDASSTRCNRDRFRAGDRPAVRLGSNGDVLCFPGALSLDRLGNLYVSDHSLEVDGNKRLLVFSASSFPSTSSTAIFAPNAVKILVRATAEPSNLSSQSWDESLVITPSERILLAATWETAFDSANRMVVGYNAYSDSVPDSSASMTIH